MILVRISKEDLKVILRDLGSILFVVGYILLLPLAVACIYKEKSLYFAFIYPSMAAIWTGFFLKKLFRGAEETKLKHAMIDAGLAWLVVSLIGAFPYWHYGFSPLDSYFESMSGFTTTGMTTIQNVEVLPKSLLFWRALAQWIGGVGVIMLFLVVLLQSQLVVRRFYSAEARSERVTPAVSTTITYIWRIYFLFTAFGVTLYYLAGMNLFDAVAHTFTSLATGGFSTQNLSIRGYDSLAIEAVAVLLMLVGGISFVVHYRVLTEGRRELLKNLESRAFLAIIFIASLLVSLHLMYEGFSPLNAFRYGVFQAVAVMTTTGYTTADMFPWSDFIKIVLLFLMFTGGCSGSTAGGFKVLRVVIFLKDAYHEIIRTILPEKAVVHLKVGNRIMEREIILRLSGMFFLFIAFGVGGGIVFTLLGYDALAAMSLSFSALGNVGPVFLSPQDWFALSSLAKSILIFEMWIGRLEIFPALALISALLIAIRREQIST